MSSDPAPGPRRATRYTTPDTTRVSESVPPTARTEIHPLTDPTTASTEEPTGSCVLCWRRDPYQPAVCEPCRSWLAGLITDLRILHEQLRNETSAAAAEGAASWPALDWNTRQKGDPVGHRRDAPLT